MPAIKNRVWLVWPLSVWPLSVMPVSVWSPMDDISMITLTEVLITDRVQAENPRQ